MTTRQKIVTIFLLISAATFYSTGYALNENFSTTSTFPNEKFVKGTEEIKKEIGKIGFTKNSPKEKLNNKTSDRNFDLKSKASELGISEKQLSEMLKSVNIDSLQTDALNSSVLYGQHSSDFFGYSVSKAGDINGDGYSDILIGSPQNNAAGTMAGRVFIYFGGTNINPSPDIILTASASGDYFGCSVSDAGDLNGDGFGDFIIGAEYADVPASSIGKAYIYYGGNIISHIPSLTLTGFAGSDFFGTSVACAGDVNSDGYSDVIVGASYNDAGGTNSGAAFIFYGGVTMNNVSDLTLAGESAYDAFGFCVASAGDINGDGFSDVIVGAPYNDAGAADAGRAYVYLGGSSMNNTADLIYTGAAAVDVFGNSVSGAGDVNADGYEDIIIGAPLNSSGGINAGRAYLYFGGALPDNTVDVTFTGSAANDYLGYSVACAGDVNCDGFSDMIIGVPNSDIGGTNWGCANIYYGGTSFDNIADIIVKGTATNDDFSYSVAGAGDVNGDGISDFLVGSPFISGSLTGFARLYTNSMNGKDISDLEISGQILDYGFGRTVAGAGDLNGDGYDDFMIGEPFANSNGLTSCGAIYIFFGGPGLSATYSKKIIGPSNYLETGHSLASAGDVNGDGFDDIISGGYPFHSGGIAFLYYGGLNMDTIQDLHFDGQSLGDELGFDVAGAGDVNGDGYDDVLLSQKGAGSNSVKAKLYFGGKIMNNDEDVVFRNSLDASESSVFSGDFNNDGFSDIAVGSPKAKSLIGQVFICLGGTNMDTTKDFVFSGFNTDDEFGHSIASGDLNNDGYSDLIVGAPDNNDAGVLSGKVYVYYGGQTMNSFPSFSIPGLIAGEHFGFSVANAGDVNNDGFTDFAVGAPYSVCGKAYIFYGGINISTTPSITTGDNAPEGEHFGYEVDNAGDINGDGLSDLITCAPHYSIIGITYGKASVFLSSSPPVIPRILKVADVPNDQGGNVLLKFQRSGYDVIGQTKITSYIVERSRPPGANGFFWEQVAVIAPNYSPGYLYTASTWGDSSSNGSDKIYFRVTAKTLNASEYWRSNIVYGQSIDNLSPASPTGLAAAPTSVKINLSWAANTEPDMKDYLVYRNGVNITSAASVSFSDTTALADSVYIYKIAARDIHGNISPLSTADTASLESITTINVTVIPEGLLNTGTNQLRLRDTIKAKLWDLTGSVIVNSATAVIDSITFIASFTFKNAPSGDYYLAIVHRNSIETWSKTGGENYTRGTTTTYDFTSANTQAYGNNLKLKGGRYCMYSGDVNGSGVINSTDRTLIRSNVGQTGYIRFDLDGNGVVNSADRTIVRNNTGIAKQRP